MSADARQKPVKLQINNTGAWKDVTHFDAQHDHVGDQVLEAANTLGQIDAHRVSYRLVTEGALPEVLMSWSKDGGWKEAAAHARSAE